MNKIDLAKAGVNLIVGTGTGKIVASIIQNNTNPETLTDKVSIGTSGFVLGCMAADVTKVYTNKKIDDAVAWWNLNVKKN